MKRIGITLKPNSYTPEAYAYERYLSKYGWQVQLDYELDPNNDVNIYFMGMRPFWQKQQGRAIEIHEYQSLSTPPYAKFKDCMKSAVNKKPSGRIFLNDIVRNELYFNDNIPYVCRDMGIDGDFFQKPNENPDFDIIYCGSIQGRFGLVEALLKLAKAYRIILVGNVDDNLIPVFQKANITLTGRIDRKYLPELYRNAKYGLNYTPDIYPFNIQTSTKTLEYLASGLQVISNRYEWAERFFSKINYIPIWLNNDFTVVENGNGDIPNVSMLEWGNLLKEIKFNEFLALK